MSDELITVKTFFYDHETLLLEPMLQSAGIDYFLKDHRTVTVDPFLSNAIGGIKLQVRPEDVERTLELLKEIEKNKEVSNQEQAIIVDDIEFEKTFEECPKCESEEVYMEKLTGVKSFTGMFTKNRFYCKSCQHEWKQHGEMG
jgi:DNA-directed RNA polymerase subunit M/transcription elongation factor TFIIS